MPGAPTGPSGAVCFQAWTAVPTKLPMSHADAAELRLGVDLGGTKIEIIALDREGTELLRERRPTPREDYDGTVDCVRSMVESAESALGRRGSVGIGVPGAISPASGLMKNANSTWLNGRPFDQDLSKALSREVRLQNDANCLAVSEATDGAGAGEAVVFAGILGTGVGSGIAIHGRPLTGRHAIAGEWGHNPLPWPEADELPGPKCFCGQHGCIETFLAGPGLIRDYRLRTGDTDQALEGGEIARRAQAGEAGAIATLERYFDRLARALAHVINVLDPDTVVFGGGVSKLAAIYDELPRRLPAYVFSDVCTTRIRPAAHGDSSGVRGAAWLWPLQ